MNFDHARFLIIRLSSIGDVLHATAVARSLKRSCPTAHLTWLVSPPASELLRCNPDIDELLIWDRAPFDRAIAEAYSKGQLVVEAMPEWRQRFIDLYEKIEHIVKRSQAAVCANL